MKKVLIAIAIGVLVFFYFYSNKSTQVLDDDLYGKSFNNARLEKHLPIIEESWVIRLHDSTHTRWGHVSTYNKRDTPEHIWKTLYFKNSALVSEEDAFNYDQGDSIGDRLIIVSNFQEPDSVLFKFSRHYYRSYPPSKSVEVDFEFADSVLNKWGFRNLYIKANPSVPVQ